MNLFGWQISRKIKGSSKKEKPIPALVPEKDDGAIISTAAGGYYGQYVDVSGGDVKNQNDLIRRYRWAASQPEIDMAINDIIDQAIASGDNSAPISLIMEDLDQPDLADIHDVIPQTSVRSRRSRPRPIQRPWFPHKRSRQNTMCMVRSKMEEQPQVV